MLFGGETLRDFGFALLIGVASGTYSSIFIAAPVLTHWKERETVWRRRERIVREDHGGVIPAYAEAALGDEGAAVRPIGRRRVPARAEKAEPEPAAGTAVAQATAVEEPPAEPEPEPEPEPAPATPAAPPAGQRPRTPEERRAARRAARAAAQAAGGGATTAGPAKGTAGDGDGAGGGDGDGSGAKNKPKRTSGKKKHGRSR
jgi:SecD/SecF fusion protein